MQPPPAPTSAHAASRGGLGFLGTAVLWFSAVVLGFAVLQRHATTPGETAGAPSGWPTASGLVRSADRATLLLFVHPKCPCTRATMGELEILLARSAGRVEACVLFVRPAGVGEGWERTSLWARAEKIPDVTVRADEGGVEATRFGARTSGEVRVYDPSGALRFAGGITGARGHSGDNPGRAAVEGLLAGRSDMATSTPVYGCALLAAPSGVAKEAACAR